MKTPLCIVCIDSVYHDIFIIVSYIPAPKLCILENPVDIQFHRHPPVTIKLHRHGLLNPYLHPDETDVVLM